MRRQDSPTARPFSRSVLLQMILEQILSLQSYRLLNQYESAVNIWRENSALYIFYQI